MTHELESLLSAWCDDRLDEAAQHQLESLLRKSAEAMDFTLMYMDQHAALVAPRPVCMAVSSKLETRNSKKISPSPSRFKFRVSSFSIAALIALAAALYFVFLPSTPHSALPTPHSNPPASFAILSDLSTDAQFADGERPLGEGLTAPIKLTAGKAQLMFQSTAVVDLTGPCEFEMTGPNRGKLTSGRLEAYCRPEAHGFTVDLPHGARVVDLGTRFDLTIDPLGAAQVEVREGRVRLERDGEPDRIMTVGRIARIAGDEPTWLDDLNHARSPTVFTAGAAALDPDQWLAVTIDPAAVSVDQGRIKLVNRGWLATRRQYDPHERDLRAAGVVTIGSPDDILGFTTRASIERDNDKAGPMLGLSVVYYPDVGRIRIYAPSDAVVTNVRIDGSMIVRPDDAFEFELIDTGTSISFNARKRADADPAVTLTADVDYVGPANHVIVFNRERTSAAHTAYVNELTIGPSNKSHTNRQMEN
ncbi:MAG: hypothetical protein GC162_20775 [Planctomycetes bacterium]|nr:hypothetical protein [Planctomycetota bacterium]